MDQAQELLVKDVIPHHIPTEDNDSLRHFRKALRSPSLEEVEAMITAGILAFNGIQTIELKRPEGTVKLESEPRHILFPDVLASVNASLPTALIGPAGSGKSTLALQVAKALELKFFLQNSVSGEHQLTGYQDAHGRYLRTTFREAFEHGGVYMLDEMDTSDATALKWLNTALANGYAVFPDQLEPIYRHTDFRVIGAANTFGTGADRIYVGANQLDASTLDRFVFIDFQYDEQLELLAAGDEDWTKYVQAIRKAAYEERARVVISPRASINGAKLKKLGWDEDKVLNAVIWKGMDAELKKRIQDKTQRNRSTDLTSITNLSWARLKELKLQEKKDRKQKIKDYQTKH